MTQSFTEKELKKARDNVYNLVSEGKLPQKTSINKAEIELISSIFAETLKSNRIDDEKPLSGEAIELLSTMLCEGVPAVLNKQNDNLLLIEIGGQYIIKQYTEKAQYPSFIVELLAKGLVYTTGDKLEITEEGEKLISTLVQTTATYTQKKIKCLKCGLHFIICTWYKEAHNSSSIACPECGQNNGDFLIWSQQKFGFIFQDVPGNSKLYSIGNKLL